MRILVERSRALPLAQLGVSLPAGSSHVPPERQGLARLVGRMLRRGAVVGGEALGSEAIEAHIDRLGGDFGVHVGLGVTSAGCEALARSLQEVAKLVSALVARPTFDAVELERLKRQTEAELWSSRDDDGGLAARALRRHLFAGHPHGRRGAGTIEGVRRVTRDDVVAFHERHYRRDGAIVTLCGDIADDVEAALAELLAGGLAPAEESPEYPVPEPSPRPGRHLVIVDKPDRSQSQLGIGTLGTHPRDPDHTALQVASTVFGGTFSSRLMQEIRAKRGWSYGASSHLVTSRVREAFSMWTAPAAEDTAGCLALEIQLLERLCRGGIDAAELGFAKGYLRRSHAFEIDTAKKRLQQKLDEALLELPDDYHSGYLARLEAVTLDEVNAAVRRRIDPSALVVAVVCTAADIGAELRAAADWASVTIEPFDAE